VERPSQPRTKKTEVTHTAILCEPVAAEIEPKINGPSA